MSRYFCAYTLLSVVGKVTPVVVLDDTAIAMGDTDTTGILADFKVNKGRVGEDMIDTVVMSFEVTGNITRILNVIVQGVDIT